jgi:hypothetical protein
MLRRVLLILSVAGLVGSVAIFLASVLSFGFYRSSSEKTNLIMFVTNGGVLLHVSDPSFRSHPTPTTWRMMPAGSGKTFLGLQRWWMPLFRHRGYAMEVFIPAWMLCVVFAAWPILELLPHSRRRRRRLRGLCGYCGYNLCGSSGRCPECGSTSPPKVRCGYCVGTTIVRRAIIVLCLVGFFVSISLWALSYANALYQDGSGFLVSLAAGSLAVAASDTLYTEIRLRPEEGTDPISLPVRSRGWSSVGYQGLWTWWNFSCNRRQALDLWTRPAEESGRLADFRGTGVVRGCMWDVVIPFWIPSVLSGSTLAASAMGFARRRCQRRSGVCLGCGYPVVGAPEL